MNLSWDYWKPLCTQFLIVNGAYYTALSLILLLGFLFYYKGSELKTLFKKNFAGLICSVLLAALVFTLAHRGFRIFSDETNLLSVSETMAHGMKVRNVVNGYYAPSGEMIALGSTVPTRPLLFPFLTTCVHWVLGVHPENALIVNFILLSLLLFTTWALLAKSPWWLRGLLTATLALNAAIAWHAPTGGFDLCSLCWGLWTVIALWAYLKEPRTENLVLLILTSLCFVQVRYESLAVVVFLIVLVILYRRKKMISDLQGQWLLFFLPLLLLPTLIQRVVTWGQFENPADSLAFNPDSIPDHGQQFLQAFFWDWPGIYPILVNFLGLAGICFLLRECRQRSQRFLIGFCAAYGFFLLVLLLAHFYGEASAPTQIRLFMPLSALFFFAMALGWTLGTDSKWKRITLAVVSVLQIAWGAYVIHLDTPRESLSIAFENAELIQWIQDHHLDRALFVYRRPNHLMAFGHSSMSMDYFEKHQDAIQTLAKNNTVSAVYDVEAVLNKEKAPSVLSTMAWRRELKGELPVTSEFKLQIYQLHLQ